MSNKLYEDGICTAFGCICVNNGDCDNCWLLDSYVEQCNYDFFRKLKPPY